MISLALLRQGFPLGFVAGSAILGAIIGSFLGVVAERVPGWVRGEEGAANLVYPPSHCPVCKHKLSSWENIPVISWLALRGRCRQCRTAIPLRLLLVELSSALFFALSAWQVADLALLLSLWVLWCGLLPLTIIDFRERLLPDCITQPLLWAGLLLNLNTHLLSMSDALYGAAAGYLVLWLVYWGFRLCTGREGLGYGDFKLLAALGAWCGWQALPTIILLAALSGIVGYLIFIRSVKNNPQIPFGPCLAFAGIVIFISQNSASIF